MSLAENSTWFIVQVGGADLYLDKKKEKKKNSKWWWYSVDAAVVESGIKAKASQKIEVRRHGRGRSRE